MNIKKFKVTVTIEKQFEIEVNTDIINDQFLNEFSSYMWAVDGVEEIVEHAAHQAAHFNGYFIEGIGEWPKSYERKKNLADQGIHIKELDEDTEVEVNAN